MIDHVNFVKSYKIIVNEKCTPEEGERASGEAQN